MYRAICALLAVAAIVVALPRVAAADPAGPSSGDAAVPFESAPPLTDVVVPHKSPALALALSLGITVAGGVLFGVAVTNGESQQGSTPDARQVFVVGGALTGMMMFAFGPTVGHLYAHEPGVNLGLKIRIAAVAAFVGGGTLFLLSCNTFYCPQGEPEIGEGLAIAAGAVLLAGTVIEIATAPSAARSFNRRHASDVPTLSIGPVRGATHTAPGLVLSGHF